MIFPSFWVPSPVPSTILLISPPSLVSAPSSSQRMIWCSVIFIELEKCIEVKQKRQSYALYYGLFGELNTIFTFLQIILK